MAAVAEKVKYLGQVSSTAGQEINVDGKTAILKPLTKKQWISFLGMSFVIYGLLNMVN